MIKEKVIHIYNDENKLLESSTRKSIKKKNIIRECWKKKGKYIVKNPKSKTSQTKPWLPMTLKYPKFFQEECFPN